MDALCDLDWCMRCATLVYHSEAHRYHADRVLKALQCSDVSAQVLKVESVLLRQSMQRTCSQLAKLGIDGCKACRRACKVTGLQFNSTPAMPDLLHQQ